MDSSAFRVAQDDEERRSWWGRQLQAPATSGREDVARDPNDEEFAKAGVENQFGGNSRIAAAQNGGVGMLAFGEVGEDLLLHRGESRGAGEETLVSGFKAFDASSAVMAGLRADSYRLRFGSRNSNVKWKVAMKRIAIRTACLAQ